MIRHERGFYVVDKLIAAAEPPELLPITAQLLATQFDWTIVGKFANANACLVQRLVGSGYCCACSCCACVHAEILGFRDMHCHTSLHWFCACELKNRL